MSFAIDVRGLTKCFGKKIAVDGIDLAIPEGEVWGFLGPNGSGKTTTLRMLCGLIRPDKGEGTCLGHDIRSAHRIKRNVGYMTQKFSFWEDLTTKENLQFVAELYGLGDAKRSVDDILKRFDLKHRADERAGALSGGLKQRLALAACMLHAPRLLLLDEPTAGVDPKARRDFWDEIHSLSDEGLTVLVSTHYMDEAERCDRIVYILNGKIIARGSVAEVIAASHLSTFVVEGEGARRILHELAHQPGVEHAAFFGASLHVSGSERIPLEQALEPYRTRAELDVHAARPGLEDVFIHLQGTP